MATPNRRGLTVVVLLLTLATLACRANEEGDTAALPAPPPRTEQPGPTRGPLRVMPENTRYFTDGSGRAVLLVGSHTWNSLQDWGKSNPPPAFDYEGYLDLLSGLGHNFVRLWAWENARWSTGPGDWYFAPMPFRATGPGRGEYGGPRFDLGAFDDAYFQRLRQRVVAAGERGMYVSVMLFQGWSVDNLGGKGAGQPWRGHPFHRANNVNGVDGDPRRTGQGTGVHTLADPLVTSFQEAYVRKVVETVNDLDNVLFEISNESPAGSTAWQYHMIELIHRLERGMPKQHPVGMTFQWPDGNNHDLLASPAEWVSVGPGPGDAYKSDPPASDGAKVILTDTDHLWGIGGDPRWVWASFLRGLNPIFMDGEPKGDNVLEPAGWRHAVRLAMAQVRSYAERIDLRAMRPNADACSTGYCLAQPGTEYLVYQPDGGPFSVHLAPGAYQAEWFRPATGEATAAGTVDTAGGRHEFRPPNEGPAVLYLKLRR